MIPPFIEDSEGHPFMRWPQDFPAIHPRKDPASSGPDGHKLARPVLSPFHASEVTDD